METEGKCGQWWKSFYCLLPEEHEGPHEDWGTWQNLPGKSGGETPGSTDFHVRWGKGAIEDDPGEMVRVA
ncbi:hypothetical protein MUP37_02300 [Candidatus Bathyarchaeota archaeon]|nr:hypothetical protein [Candidatus Bathyarchaeota archaeon]